MVKNLKITVNYPGKSTENDNLLSIDDGCCDIFSLHDVTVKIKTKII